MIKAVLFDLDGTLLPMDQDKFIKEYLKSLAAYLAPFGYEPSSLIKGIWEGTGAMVYNDGRCTNEQRFWTRFAELCGEVAKQDIAKFDSYYSSEFACTKEFCSYNGKAKEVIDMLNGMGITVALATNPIFPAIATQQRMSWAGLKPTDFKLYTTYENCCYCKPNLNYYKEILNNIGCNAEEALMVGNDVSDDMVAANLGMQVFLLTDCLINKNNEDITKYPRGSFDELTNYILSNK